MTASATTPATSTIRFLETAAEQYSLLDFQDPSALFNKPAPEPRVTFAIGGVRCICVMVHGRVLVLATVRWSARSDVSRHNI